MFKKIIVLFSLLICACSALAQDFPPKPTTLVTDYTNTLSAGDRQSLENKVVAFDDTSSTQIAVVIIKSVGDYDVDQYGAALGRKWGIGQKGKNNGVLILVALNDRKMTIQTGYGVEGALPDVIAMQIRENDINPRFRAGDYYGGLNAGIDDIIKYTKGEYKADKKSADKNHNSGGSYGIIIIIVIIVLVMIFRNRGGGGQVIGSGGSSSPFWWLLAGSMLGSRGGGDWGGFSGGGGGGDSGGGGFGGFGGGDFGGGGSGGSW
jgi:uncharacterized protein